MINKKHYFYVGYNYILDQKKYVVFLWQTDDPHYLTDDIRWQKFNTYEEASEMVQGLKITLYAES